MRPLYFLMLISGIPQVSVAQQWCTSNATWRSWSAGFGREVHRETTCGVDTTINGLQAHRMENRNVGFVIFETVDHTNHGYTAADEDILWYVKSTTPFELDTLANFDAQPGDAWTYEDPGSPNFNVHVTATGTGLRDFGSIQLRYVTVDYTAMFGPVNDTIFERIGPLHIDPFTPTIAFGMESDYSGLLCYHDDDIVWVAAYQPIDCFAPLSVEDGSRTANGQPMPQLFPNPSSGAVFCVPARSTDTEVPISIHDAQGRSVVHCTLSDLARGLDLSYLAPGCYRFVFSDSRGTRSSMIWLRH